jgi:GNAT superfamily N-acetyltransferase
MIEVRPATTADVDALAALRWEFRAGREAPAESQASFLARCTEWMRQALETGAWRSWVAVRDDRIVGQVWLHPFTKLPNPVGERERHAYLSNLFVVPDERGGVGTQLLERALDWAAAHGVDRVVLWPSARSVTLYERHGFVREGDVLELTCPPAASPPQSRSST